MAAQQQCKNAVQALSQKTTPTLLDVQGRPRWVTGNQLSGSVSSVRPRTDPRIQRDVDCLRWQDDDSFQLCLDDIIDPPNY